MTFKESITIKAGNKALKIIEDKGFTPDSVSVAAGAAGGPKWLILRHLDRAVFGNWLLNKAEPLPLIGSSIGSWRFACICCKDQEQAFNRFEEAYINQSYVDNSSPSYISSESLKIVKNYLRGQMDEVLNHPIYRLNIMAVECSWPSSSQNKYVQIFGFGMSYILNMIKRETLNFQFKRALFHDGRHEPDFFCSDQFRIEKIKLDTENLCDALMSSASIPVVMEGVRRGKKLYRDGGIIDYNMDLKYENTDGIVLFPHYSDRVIPGWLDKNIKKRGASDETLDKMLLIAPSEKMISSLPGNKIPDRNDFMKMDDETRIKVWKDVIEKSRVMYDDFLLLTENNSLLNDTIQGF